MIPVDLILKIWYSTVCTSGNSSQRGTRCSGNNCEVLCLALALGSWHNKREHHRPWKHHEIWRVNDFRLTCSQTFFQWWKEKVQKRVVQVTILVSFGERDNDDLIEFFLDSISMVEQQHARFLQEILIAQECCFCGYYYSTTAVIQSSNLWRYSHAW